MQRSRAGAKGRAPRRRTGSRRARDTSQPLLSAKLSKGASRSRRKVKKASGLTDRDLVTRGLGLYARLHGLMGRQGGSLVSGRYSLVVRNPKDGHEDVVHFL